jgi:hypothetical protein
VSDTRTSCAVASLNIVMVAPPGWISNAESIP